MQGTHLTNVTRVATRGGTWENLHGAYLWPNGALTVYPTPDRHFGTILSPDYWTEIYFGKEGN